MCRCSLRGVEQHFLGVDIEVVGRFVEQQRVGRSKQHAGDRRGRVRSPPERTPAFLYTSSPENRKPPRMFADRGIIVSGAPETASRRPSASDRAASLRLARSNAGRPDALHPRAGVRGAPRPTASASASICRRRCGRPGRSDRRARCEVHMVETTFRRTPFSTSFRSSTVAAAARPSAGNESECGDARAAPRCARSLPSSLMRLCTCAAFDA